MSATSCPKCGAPTRVVKIGAQQVILNATPDPIDGNVLSVVPGVGTFLSGPTLGAASKAVPNCLYMRHGIRCPNFWGEDIYPATQGGG